MDYMTLKCHKVTHNKDLGGTLRRTSKTTLRSYDSRASGDQKCPHRQGCVANVAKNNRLDQESCNHLLLATADRNVGTAFFSKSDTMRWQFWLPAYSCDFESHKHILDRKGGAIYGKTDFSKRGGQNAGHQHCNFRRSAQQRSDFLCSVCAKRLRVLYGCWPSGVYRKMYPSCKTDGKKHYIS